MKYLEFFTIDVWTMIFTLVNMFIVYVIVKKLLFKPVLKVLDRRDAEIKKIYVDEGPTLKRFRARAKGSGTQILKRTCHITCVVEER